MDITTDSELMSALRSVGNTHRKVRPLSSLVCLNAARAIWAERAKGREEVYKDVFQPSGSVSSNFYPPTMYPAPSASSNLTRSPPQQGRVVDNPVAEASGSLPPIDNCRKAVTSAVDSDSPSHSTASAPAVVPLQDDTGKRSSNRVESPCLKFVTVVVSLPYRPGLSLAASGAPLSIPCQGRSRVGDILEALGAMLKLSVFFEPYKLRLFSSSHSSVSPTPSVSSYS